MGEEKRSGSGLLASFGRRRLRCAFLFQKIAQRAGDGPGDELGLIHPAVVGLHVHIGLVDGAVERRQGIRLVSDRDYIAEQPEGAQGLARLGDDGKLKLLASPSYPPPGRTANPFSKSPPWSAPGCRR